MLQQKNGPRNNGFSLCPNIFNNFKTASDDVPAFCFQPTPDFLVALLVAGNLGCPESRVCFGNMACGATFVPMPEASVNENNSAVFGKDNIWRSGESFIIYPIAESLVPEYVAQLHLRLR